MKIYCGGIEIPLDVKVSYVDYIFCYIDLYNYYYMDYWKKEKRIINIRNNSKYNTLFWYHYNYYM